MTIDFKVGTVISSIAALSISGVNIRDIDELPENAEMALPLLIPNPEDPITDIETTRQSFGSMGTAKIDMAYTLNFLYLHAKVGSGLTINSNLPGLVANLALIEETILTNDVVSGAVDIYPLAIQRVGIIEDPTGKQYHGCALSFRVLEHVQ